MGSTARTSPANGRRDPAPRAPDSHIPPERRRPRRAPGARAGEGSDSEVVKRRAFLTTVRRYVATTVGLDLAGFRPTVRVSGSLLIPMDDVQTDHLKAYGVTYRVVQAGIKAEWLLDYRGGSFLLPDGAAIRRDAALAGVSVQPVEEAQGTAIRGEMGGRKLDGVPHENAAR